VIFPHRKIGALQEVYEASFVVLEADPIKEFNEIKKIRMRVKRGNPLN